jgi:hypothetical protein
MGLTPDHPDIKDLHKFDFEKAAEGGITVKEFAFVGDYHGSDMALYVAGKTEINGEINLVYSGSVDHDTQLINIPTFTEIDEFSSYDVMARPGFTSRIPTKVPDLSYLPRIKYEERKKEAPVIDFIVMAAYRNKEEKLNGFQRGEDRICFVAGITEPKGVPFVVYSGRRDHKSKNIKSGGIMPVDYVFSYNKISNPPF